MKTIRSSRPVPERSATARPAPWFSQLNQSGTSIQGVQLVGFPAASSRLPTRYRPRFWPPGSSTMTASRSRPPSPTRSATATLPPAFWNENQSGMGS